MFRLGICLGGHSVVRVAVLKVEQGTPATGWLQICNRVAISANLYKEGKVRAVPCMVFIFPQPVFLCVVGIQLCPLDQKTGQRSKQIPV